MRRLLIGIGIALLGSLCALGWQLSGSVAVGWLGAVGLVAGGLTMLSPLLLDTPTVAAVDDDDDEGYITVAYTVGERKRI